MSNNPRICVTLKPRTAAVLRRLSAATGNSMSAIVADLLEDSEAVLKRAAVTLEAAQTVMQEARAKAVEGQREDQRAIHEQVFGLQETDFEEAQLDLLDDAETIKRRAARAVQPPSLTGGSQTLAAPRATSSKSTAKPRQQRKGAKNGAI